MFRIAVACGFILITLEAISQVTIGTIKFNPVSDDKKPPATLGGYLEVFENNISKKGKKIKLYIEVVPSRSGKKSEPLFIIMGGPGQASTDMVSFFAEVLQKVNEQSDLVFIDQRGTGKSNPFQLKASYASLQDYFTDEFMSDSLIAQTQRALSRENDLTQYTTYNAILDIESVRDAMSYTTINLYGTSYGTRVALAYINRFPKKVRTATLKGLVPYELIIPLNFARDAQRSMDLLIADCKSNNGCNTAYPDFENTLTQLFSQRFPVSVEVTNPETGLKEKIQVSKEAIGLALRVMLMAPSISRTIPYQVTEASKGNYDPLAQTIVTIKKSYIKGVYDGMTLCVVCQEDYPALKRSNPDSPLHKKGFLGDYWIRRVMNACRYWNPSGRGIDKSSMSIHDIPVLLISGNRDGATPPAYGDQVLKKFPNGKHVIVSQGGHSFDGMRNCVENIISEFIVSGNTSAVQSECADQISFGEYKLN